MRILMVCLGNICRSPLAEGILRHYITKHQLSWKVSSAGTAADYHLNAMADYNSTAVAEQHQIDIKQHRAKLLTLQDIKTFDCIYVMDKQNLSEVTRLCNGDKTLQSKVKLLLSEIPNHTDLEVPDPYRKGEKAFASVFNMIDKACLAIINKIN